MARQKYEQHELMTYNSSSLTMAAISKSEKGNILLNGGVSSYISGVYVCVVCNVQYIR